jgi:hypothetical protein
MAGSVLAKVLLAILRDQDHTTREGKVNDLWIRATISADTRSADWGETEASRSIFSGIEKYLVSTSS